jgi:hypothetical protein
MFVLRATKTLAIFLTLVDAVLWTYHHRVVGLLMLAVAVLVRFLPEESMNKYRGSLARMTSGAKVSRTGSRQRMQCWRCAHYGRRG